jgi:hypothetical protein
MIFNDWKESVDSAKCIYTTNQKIRGGFKHDNSSYLFTVVVRLAHRANEAKTPFVFPLLNTDTSQPFTVGPDPVRCRSWFPGVVPELKPPPVTWVPAGHVAMESKSWPGLILSVVPTSVITDRDCAVAN